MPSSAALRVSCIKKHVYHQVPLGFALMRALSSTHLCYAPLAAELCEIKTLTKTFPFFKIEKKCCPSDDGTCWRDVFFGHDVCCPNGECALAHAYAHGGDATAKRLTWITAGCADKWTGSACCTGDKTAGKVDS